MTIIVPSYNDILSDWELKYALRSVEKYLIGFSNIILVGDKPEWYNGEHIQVNNHDNRKQFSIYSKLLAACELNNVTDRFIMWMDDFYLLKQLSVDNIHAGYDGFLKDYHHKTHGLRYVETIKRTLSLIPDTLNYDIHRPYIFNKADFKILFSDRTDEICFQSYYFNHVKSITEPVKDLKINQLLSKEAIKELIKDRLFFSTSTNGMKKPMIELLNELYPNKSSWEK